MMAPSNKHNHKLLAGLKQEDKYEADGVGYGNGGLLLAKSELIIDHLFLAGRDRDGEVPMSTVWYFQVKVNSDSGKDNNSLHLHKHVAHHDARRKVEYKQVGTKDGEALHAALARSMHGGVPLSSTSSGLFIIDIGDMPQSSHIGLSNFLLPFVNECGLLVVWKYPQGDSRSKSSDSDLTATSFLMEFARIGLVPATFGEGVESNYFDLVEGFVVYFEKKPYSIRNPSPNDLEQLLRIDAESWSEKIRYSPAVMEGFILNKSNDVIIMAVGSNDIVGAMFTQRVHDVESIDAVPWKESISISAGVKCSSGTGTVKQLLRVSTKGAGKGIQSLSLNTIPGSALRDFVLNVAASQGISQVVRNIYCTFPIVSIAPYYLMLTFAVVLCLVANYSRSQLLERETLSWA